MAQAYFGICHLCGSFGRLSFEHVPPQSAFNNHRILRTRFDELLAANDLDNLRGKVQQRGSGGYTLCRECNSKTGVWYVPAFASWARQAMRVVIGARKPPTLFYPYNLHPLRVLKQVLCMFFSINGPRFHAVNPDLVRFILNKESKELPDRVRVDAFYTLSNRTRTSGMTGVIQGLGTASSKVRVFSEVTFPPFGFVLTMNSIPPRSDFCDISGFSKFEYSDWRPGIRMRMPLLPIYTGFPGDYRTRKETLVQAAAQMEEQYQQNK